MELIMTDSAWYVCKPAEGSKETDYDCSMFPRSYRGCVNASFD
jgi:hypothetical protein